MDFSVILSTIVDFVKLLLLLSIICFILYKLFSPVRVWLERKFNLSWVKSVALLNFVLLFLGISFVYFYFAFVGLTLAPARDPALGLTLSENLGVIVISLGRILVASIILSLFLLFFELVASMFMGKKEEVSKKSKTVSNNWLSEFIGVMIACAIFLVLILFVFDWAIVGLFLFIFYGSVNSLPLLLMF